MDGSCALCKQVLWLCCFLLVPSIRRVYESRSGIGAPASRGSFTSLLFTITTPPPFSPVLRLYEPSTSCSIQPVATLFLSVSTGARRHVLCTLRQAQCTRRERKARSLDRSIARSSRYVTLVMVASRTFYSSIMRPIRDGDSVVTFSACLYSLGRCRAADQQV